MRRTILMMMMLLMIGTMSFGVTTSDVTVIIDGEPMDTIDEEQNIELPPYIHDDRTVIPVRNVVSTFGIASEQIAWISETRSVEIVTNRGDVIVMQIGNRDVQFNDKILKTDVAPLIIDNRTYLPLSALTTLFEMPIGWDSETRTVTLDPSIHLLEDYQLTFQFPVSKKYVLHNESVRKSSYSLRKHDLEENDVVSSVDIVVLDDKIDTVFEDYLYNNYLNSDDFKILSNEVISFVRYDGNYAVAFSEVGNRTLKLEIFNFSSDDLRGLVDSVKEVKK